MGTKGKQTSKEDWTWQRGVAACLLGGSNGRKSHLPVRRWESEKHRSWCMPVEGFRDHVAIDGSLLESQAGGVCV